MKNHGTHSYVEDKRNETIKIFINGDFFIRERANISVFDSGFLLGDGVWEGIRLLNGHFVFLDSHFDRLYRGAKQLAIRINYTKDELRDLLQKTVDANEMFTGVHIRLIITRGMKTTPYQHPNVNIGNSSIVIIPEFKEPKESLNINGIRLVTVNTRRGTSDSQDPRLNTLSKINCIMACIEADSKGCDEGIMLDVNGNVATCNSTNFFIIKKGEVWTSSGKFCLPGVTRKAVIDLCNENKIPIKQKDFSIEDVHSADEAFVTGTFSGIIPAIEIDDISISNSIRGKLTNKLQNYYINKLNTLYN